MNGLFLSRKKKGKRNEITGLLLFPVTVYRPAVEGDGKARERTQLRKDICQTTAFEIYHAHHFHEIAQRIEVGDVLRPLGHAADGGEQSAHQDEQQHAEPHHEHGLLHGRRVVGNDQPQPRYDQDKDQCGEVDMEDVALWRDAVCQCSQSHAKAEY